MGPAPCRLVGIDQKDLENRVSDLPKRLDAIAEGVEAVKSAFGRRVVDRVNIVNYEEIHNAVTCEGNKDLCFYLNVLRGEPVHELKIMAEHESLHRYVDEIEITRNHRIRRRFAATQGLWAIFLRAIYPCDDRPRYS